MTTTEKKCYILDFDSKQSNDYLDIQFVPEGIFLNRAVRMEGVNIIGHNTPSYQYLGGETTVSMRLDFYSEEASRMDVIRKCKWLESLTYNEALEEPPHRVIVTFGKLFKNELWIIKSCRYDLSMFHKKKGFLPQQAYVDLIFGRWAERQISASEIREGFQFIEDDDLVENFESAMANAVVTNSVSTLSENMDASIKIITANQVNAVDQLSDNLTARDKLQRSKKAKNLAAATKVFDFAKLGIAIAKSLT